MPAFLADEAGCQRAGTGGNRNWLRSDCQRRPLAGHKLPWTSSVRPNECALAGLRQETRLYKGAEQRVAHFSVKPPQALRLCCSEPQSRHFDELPLNPLKHLVDAHGLTSARV
jgi:hypothetical protein